MNLRIKDEYIRSSDMSQILQIAENMVSQVYGTMYILYKAEIEHLKERVSILRKYEKGEVWYNKEILPYMMSIIKRRNAGEKNIIIPIYVPIPVYGTKKLE